MGLWFIKVAQFYKHQLMLINVHVSKEKLRQRFPAIDRWDFSHLGKDFVDIITTFREDKFNEKLVEQEKYPMFELMVARELIEGGMPVIVWVGRPNRGKSTAMLSFTYRMNPHHDLKNSYFSIVDMLIAFSEDYGAKTFTNDELERDINASKYGDLVNSLFTLFLSSQRVSNSLLNLVVPHIRLITKSHRYYIMFIMEMISWGTFKVWQVGTNWSDFEKGSMFKKKLETVVNYPLPPLDKLEEYKAKDFQIKQEIREHIKAKALEYKLAKYGSPVNGVSFETMMRNILGIPAHKLKKEGD